jgi:hypothetical protein
VSIKRDREQKAFTWPIAVIVRKGAAKTDEKRPGKDLEVLRLVGTKPEIQAKINEVFHGDTVPSLHCYLAYADPKTAYWERCEKWAGGGQGRPNKLIHRCDGVTMEKWWDASKNDYSFEPKPCDKGCKATGWLRLFVPELDDAGVKGDVVVTTTAWNDVNYLFGLMQEIERVAKENGVPMSHVPLIIRRARRDVSHKQDGRRMAVSKSLLEVVLADRVIAARQAATVDTSTGEVLDEGEDEWLETGDETSPDFESEAASESVEGQLPKVQGGPGWGSVASWKEKFDAFMIKEGLRVMDPKTGKATKTGLSVIHQLYGEVDKATGEPFKPDSVPYAELTKTIHEYMVSQAGEK